MKSHLLPLSLGLFFLTGCRYSDQLTLVVENHTDYTSTSLDNRFERPDFVEIKPHSKGTVVINECERMWPGISKRSVGFKIGMTETISLVTGRYDLPGQYQVETFAWVLDPDSSKERIGISPVKIILLPGRNPIFISDLVTCELKPHKDETVTEKTQAK